MRTLSALLSHGDPNVVSPHRPSGEHSLEERVAATLSAELAVALAHQHANSYLSLPYDDPSPDEEDELEDDQYDSGPEQGPPRYRSRDGTRGQSPVDHVAAIEPEGYKSSSSGPVEEVQVMLEGLDGDAFPITLRARKGKDTAGVVSGVKRKR